MEQSKFVAYLGPAAIHDGVVRKVRHPNSSLEVEIRGADGSTISVYFRDVAEVKENRAEGMMLYAIAEYSYPGDGRLFVFANWESDDDAALSVVAEGVTFRKSYNGG